MKKHLSFISTVLVLIMIVSAAFPAFAANREKTFEKKDVTAYLYNLEKTKVIICLFDTELPEVPYIDVMEYLGITHVNEYTLTDNGDGIYTVSCDKATMTADTVNDTVYFSSYEIFVMNGVYSEGTSLAADYLQDAGASFKGNEIKPVLLDLGKYGIDIIESEGRLYFPVFTLNDIIFAVYNCAEYVDGNLYFIHTMEDMSKDGYFDRSSIYSNLQRSEKMVEYTYNELCFQIDTFYGIPSKAEIAGSIQAKGFDKTLDEYSDITRSAKALLKSTDLVDFYLGLCALSEVFFDGGHTVLYVDPVTAAQLYPDSAFGKIWNDNFNFSTEEKWVNASQAISVGNIPSIRSQLLSYAKQNAFAYYDTVKEWDAASLTVFGDIAVFTFNSFINDVIEPFKWSLDYAEENGIKNFLIDLSTNGGGSSAVLDYIITMITNKKNRCATTSFRSYYNVSGNVLVSDVRVDLDLNGVFDEKDDELAYDFNFAVLTSKASFSCGNLLPVLAKENGIMILGEASGGGTCSIGKIYTPENGFAFISDYNKFIWQTGEDVDAGAPVDVDLRNPYAYPFDLTQFGITDPAAAGLYDYDDFYDLATISALISEFYSVVGDVNGDGEIDNKDVVVLFRYVSETEKAEYNSLFDINDDGEIDNKDVTLLFRTVSAA